MCMPQSISVFCQYASFVKNWPTFSLCWIGNERYLWFNLYPALQIALECQPSKCPRWSLARSENLSLIKFGNLQWLTKILECIHNDMQGILRLIWSPSASFWVGSKLCLGDSHMRPLHEREKGISLCLWAFVLSNSHMLAHIEICQSSLGCSGIGVGDLRMWWHTQ